MQIKKNSKYFGELKMTKQTTKIAAMIILAIGFLMTGAAAQSVANDDSAPIISFTGTETVKAVEPVTGNFYGNSFVLNSFGESETQHLTVSLDYSCALNCFHNPCEGNSHFSVTGGSWSLVVFRDNVYAGTLYGKVSGGAIDVVTNRNGEPGFRQMQVYLQATGGLGRFARKGRGNISGVYEAITDAVSNQTTGSLNFTFGL